MVKLGTKWPSMTSTCSRSAWAAMASMAAPRAAKSAERIEGAIRAIEVNLPTGGRLTHVRPGETHVRSLNGGRGSRP